MAFFDRLKLLRDVEAGFPGFDHVGHAMDMPLGALEGLDDVSLGGVAVLFHVPVPIPY